ncbi:hypothetical protein DRE_02941 [Drechslerella stenobrocha 248]|uniref:Uncharacterized protein n=1 Tax=Drechslerella stenobrocha 248 TaxID=1043628 RepID=W7HU76_9PEZI|nr:hypothetical protein DRE_02941 [Drechslerella stenobrocha 248]
MDVATAVKILKQHTRHLRVATDPSFVAGTGGGGGGSGTGGNALPATGPPPQAQQRTEDDDPLLKNLNSLRPVCIQHTADPANQQFVLRPGGFQFPHVQPSFPGLKIPTIPVPLDIQAHLDRDEIQADWNCSWPFLVHAIFNEIYICGGQILLWSDGDKLCWGTIDDHKALIPDSETLKMAWPRYHEYHRQSDDEKPCESCLDEIGDTLFEDFVPALGYPPIKQPTETNAKLGKQDIRGHENVEPKDKGKQMTAAQPCRFIPGMTADGLVMDFDTKNQKYTSKLVPSTPVERHNFFNPVVGSFGSGSTQAAHPASTPVSSLRQAIFGPFPNFNKPNVPSSPAKITDAAPPANPFKFGQMAQKETAAAAGVPSLKPQKYSSSEICKQLRSERLFLSLGLARFVIDSIKDGKRPYFDISLDGRIEMGHLGSAFPIEQGREQHAYFTDNGVPRESNPEIKMCTARVIKIHDYEFEDMDAIRRDFDFPQCVVLHDMFRNVSMEEAAPIATQSGKGKNPKKARGAPDIFLGSKNYKIKSSLGERVYEDLEVLSHSLVASFDICDEAQDLLTNKDRVTPLTGVFGVEKTTKLNPTAAKPGPAVAKPSPTTQPKASATIKGKASEVAVRNGGPIRQTRGGVPAEVVDALSYQKEELLQLLKEIPPGHKTEKMGFEAHLKTMDECIKGIQGNLREAGDCIQSTLRNHPVQPKNPDAVARGVEIIKRK